MRSLPTLDLRQPLLAGAAVVLAAVVVSTSPSVARGEFIDGWRNWDVPHGKGASVGVEYVWNSNYAGIRFPKKPTTVLSIAAEEQAGVYWRATTLDRFTRGRWVEQLFEGAEPVIDGDVQELSHDPYLPAEAEVRDAWLQADVEVEGLRDTHLIGAGVPVAYAPGDREVDYFLGNVAIAPEGTERGDSYTVWSYAPQPTPRQLGRSKADYPVYVAESFLTVENTLLPPFAAPGRERRLERLSALNPRLGDYADLYRQARDVVGTNPRNPYTAVVALESWFRSGGDFVYDERPPLRRGTPPLVSFALSTKRGYCQHFAGAMAVMLRQLGIPARVAAGFTSGRYDREDGRWTVADRNAHTWVEVWFDGFGWLPFDPTPGRGQLGATYTSASFSFDVNAFRAAAGGVLPGGSDLVRGETGGPDRPRGADPGAARLSSGGDEGRGAGTGLVTLLLAVTLGAALLLAVAKLARRAGRFLTRDPRGIAGACRRDLAAFIADQGVPVPDSATPAELGGIVERQFGVDARRFVEALTLARFGPPELAGPAAGGARRELRRIRRSLRARLTVPRRARGLLSLRSLTV
jgi:transglutaminase-like putative cysteine protease